MSWLARSLANSLRIDDDDSDDDEDNDIAPDHPHDTPTTSLRNHEQHHQQQPPLPPQELEIESEHEAHARGVKEDLNELTETLTRQFWGMASFLAPPPTNSHPSSASEDRIRSDPAAFMWNQAERSDRVVSVNEDEEAELLDDDDAISGVRREFSAIYGSFRRENPEISGTDPNLNLVGSEYVGYEESGSEECDLVRPVGITEEVLAFARNIAMHPETWLDFPIDEEEDTDDFDMSNAQQEHASAIESLAPRLAALRIELCPCHMSEGYFWKVYFVLLHSRLNKQDADILSSPQVITARTMWMKELQKQMNPEVEWLGRNISYSRDANQREDVAHSLSDDAYSDDVPHETYRYEPTTVSMIADYEVEKHAVESSETRCIDKSVIEEKPMIKSEHKDLTSIQSSKIIFPDYEDDDDDWPEEDGGTTIPMVNEEDISFSDLEDDDYGIKPVKSSADLTAS